ncbi:MAG: hypothetical protein ACFFFC_18355 [Candidatus Thorarchaeota archaeon]
MVRGIQHLEGTAISRTDRMRSRENQQKRTIAKRIIVMEMISLLLLVLLVSPLPLQKQKLPDVSLEGYVNEFAYPSAEDVDLNLTYWSRTNPNIGFVNSGDRIGGDHVTLNAIWTPSSLVDHAGIEVTAPAIPSAISNSSTTNSVIIDTRGLGNNATCTINSTVWLLNGSAYSKIVENVYIGNFFIPRLTVLTPNGGETWTGTNNITWKAWDINQDETLTYEVFFSSNSGATFQSIASDLNRTWLMWDCGACPVLSTYLIQVSATDGIYHISDRSDATFTAGGPASPTTSPNTTSTTTPPPPVDPRIFTFLVLFLVTSGVMALIVYYIAKKWF